jgi:hypothetical protein
MGTASAHDDKLSLTGTPATAALQMMIDRYGIQTVDGRAHDLFCDSHERVRRQRRLMAGTTPACSTGAGPRHDVRRNAIDFMDGGSGNDVLYGWDGDDDRRRDGNDEVFGGFGNDVLQGGVARRSGRAGRRYPDGQNGDDMMDGGSNDDLYGDAGVDFPLAARATTRSPGRLRRRGSSAARATTRCTAAVGNDKLFGQAGNDEIFGDDNDTWSAAGRGILMAGWRRSDPALMRWPIGRLRMGSFNPQLPSATTHFWPSVRCGKQTRAVGGIRLHPPPGSLRQRPLASGRSSTCSRHPEHWRAGLKPLRVNSNR